MIHSSGCKFATYYRKTNRHNWSLGLSAYTDAELIRAIYYNQRDFPTYQQAYTKAEELFHILDDLPKNNNDVIRIDTVITSNESARALEDYFNKGIVPVEHNANKILNELSII